MHTGEVLEPLPEGFAETRESLHALVCFVVGPARWARTGAIQLEPAGDAIATPPFDDGSRIVVRGDRLGWEPGADLRIATLEECAAFLDVTLTADLPQIGTDLPPLEPERPLRVDTAASFALAAWYSFGDLVLGDLRATLAPTDHLSAAHLWPEHFDLGVVVTPPDGRKVNVGVSPGDAFSEEPYLYVGPWDVGSLSGPIRNAPFGAIATRARLAAEDDPRVAAGRFVGEVLAAARS